MGELKFRHEVKHVITPMDRMIIRNRMKAVASVDKNAKDGVYKIRSLYFDNIDDKALFEKINGGAKREKFRIRYYNGDISHIRLEKKSKINGLCNKQSVVITKEEVQSLLDGNIEWMLGEETENRPLIRELYTKMKGQGLKPKTIVDYTRDPFVYKPGNVRVTLDYDIRTGNNVEEFLNWNCVTLPASNNPILLEVKWDEFLADIIRDAVQLNDTCAGAFSKYVACRCYG